MSTHKVTRIAAMVLAIVLLIQSQFIMQNTVSSIFNQREPYHSCSKVLFAPAGTVCLLGLSLALILCRVMGVGASFGWKEVKAWPAIYSLGIIAGVSILTTIYVISYPPPVEPFNNLIGMYKDQEVEVDRIQASMQCCGEDSYLDWKTYILETSNTTDSWWTKIPASCRRGNVMDHEEFEKTIYTEGCSQKCHRYIYLAGSTLLLATLCLLLELMFCPFLSRIIYEKVDVEQEQAGCREFLRYVLRNGGKNHFRELDPPLLNGMDGNVEKIPADHIMILRSCSSDNSESEN